MHTVCLCPGKKNPCGMFVPSKCVCSLFEETEKLTCRTRHASQKHYHKTFAHRSHTPEEDRKSLKRTKLTLNKNSPCNCLLPLPAAFSFLSLCCFLTPCSAPPEVLDEKFSELIFFYQTSTSDFHSLLTASKIFLGLLFAFSQI